MSFKNILYIIFCIFSFLLLNNSILKEYHSENTVNQNSYNELYFLQVGIYNSEDEMKEQLKNIKYYMFNNKNNKYYTYLAITSDLENKNRLVNYYASKGYELKEKIYKINDEKFLEILSQYDLMLKESDDEVIESIESQVLAKYEETQNDFN